MTDSIPADISPDLGGVPSLVMRELATCRLCDRFQLGTTARRLAALLHNKKIPARELAALLNRFEQSRGHVSRRRESMPAISYPGELPITGRREEIAQAIREHQVILVAGETGSGKTTQLPKICLELGRGLTGTIGITQPRRIAAFSVAARLAKELGVPLGDTVGFQTRFQAKMNPLTLVKFMTDGILLNETQRDRDLLAYDTLILDEVHERNLNLDFLLGRVKRLLPKRPELRVIISSATLDVERMSEFFDNAPVISVTGRTYPVEVRYRPPDEEEEDDPDLAVMVLHAVEELLAESQEGDILVFLPGEADIREAADVLARTKQPGTVTLPLFSRLTPEEQQQVFVPTVQRKIILSTNVAETSLTIPGVRAVVDSGLARLRRVSDRASVERLQIEKISQASAEQRRGRAGRVGPGICVRLYGESDFLKRPGFTDPEIRRSSLASVILRLAYLGLGAAEDFPFLDPPQPSRLAEGRRELLELGAMDESGRLTRSGRKMAVLPIEPRFSRILLEAARRGTLESALTIVSMLAVQDPRERPLAKQGEADQLHRRFQHGKSDFLGWLELWKFYDDALATLPSKSQARKFCRRNFLHHLRMQEWRDIRRQLSEFMADAAQPKPVGEGDSGSSYADLHMSLLAGLLSRVGKRTDDGDYLGARGVKFFLWPGSGIAKAIRDKREAEKAIPATPRQPKKPAGPEWVLAAELVETSRMFGRGLAEIDPRWIEELAGPLARRSYSDPSYDPRSGFVRAREKVEVYGLPVVDGRRVHYGSIDPRASKNVFIRQALVDEMFTRKLPFFLENQALLLALEELGAKARTTVRVDDEALFLFYDQRLPDDVHNDRALILFAVEKEKSDPACLRLTREYLLANQPDGITPDRFPPHCEVNGRRYALSYRFDPGSPDDGVTMTIPVADVANIPEWLTPWLVPGLLGEKIATLLRNLPKSLRRPFTPVADAAEEALPLLKKPSGSFGEALTEALRKISKEKVPVESWKEDDLPDYLRMNLRVVDHEGKQLAQGRDLAALRQSLGETAKAAFEGIDKKRFEKTGLTAWDFGDLPEVVSIGGASGAVAYPGLVDEGAGVALRFFHNRSEADRSTRMGVLRLALLAWSKQTASLKKSLSLSRQALACFAVLGGVSDRLRDDLARAAAEEVFFKPGSTPTGAREFHQRLTATREFLHATGMELGTAADEALATASRLLKDLSRPPTPAHIESFADLSGQLEDLLGPTTFRRAAARRIKNLPRYLKAAEMRFARLSYSLGKDRQRMATLLPYRERWRMALADNPTGGAWDALDDYRWLLEEWRIGLFAQEVGMETPASEKRLDSAWKLYLNIKEG